MNKLNQSIFVVKSYLIATLQVYILVLVLSNIASSQEKNRPATANVKQGETTQVKADQERVNVNLIAKEQSQSTSSKDSQADLIKANAETKKAENDSAKIADSRTQYYFDFGYRIIFLAAGVGLLMWLFPQIQTFSTSIGGNTFSITKAPKEPVIPPTPPTFPTFPIPGQMHLVELKDQIKKSTLPGAVSSNIFDKLDEITTYQELGVLKDSIYLCHKVQSIPRNNKYRILMYLDADSSAILDKVDRVMYKLHSAKPAIEIADRNAQFAYEISASSEFMLIGEIHFKNTDKPIILKRYLNF